MKTDQTVFMAKLIRVFAGRTGHFFGFVVLRLILSYCVKIFMKTISLLADNKLTTDQKKKKKKNKERNHSSRRSCL